MEQQLPAELDTIELIPQDASQKLKDLFPTGSQFKINKVSTEGSEADFSVEITVGKNKYSGLCSKYGTPIKQWELKRQKPFLLNFFWDGAPIEQWELERGGETISITFQQSSFVEDRIWFPWFLKTVLICDKQYTFINGSKYTGELKDDKRHGKGVCTFANGSEYDGDWKDGKENGHGKYTWKNGDIYDGGFKDNKRHGKGIYTFAADGSNYVGYWKDGKRNGRGKLTWENGNIYEGDWQDDKMMTSSNKPKEQNKIETLVLRSKEIGKEDGALKYENDKFIPSGKSVEVAVCENSAEALAAIEKFIKNNKENITEENSKCRIVFRQHGGAVGDNDMSIDSESAKKILENLASAGFKEIIISDLACHGGTAHHFLEVAQDFANERGVVIRVRSAPENRACINGIKMSKTDGGTERLTTVTLGTDGPGKSRELKVFTPEPTEVSNPELISLKCKEEEKISK